MYISNCSLDCIVVGRVSVYIVVGLFLVPRSIFGDKLDLLFKAIVDNKPNDPGSS